MAGSRLRTSAQSTSLPSSRDIARYRWSPAPERRIDPDRLVLLACCFAGLIVLPLILALEGGAA